MAAVPRASGDADPAVARGFMSPPITITGLRGSHRTDSTGQGAMGYPVQPEHSVGSCLRSGGVTAGLLV